ncbi:MAG: type IV pilin [Methanoregula sp.]|nr:type IV pilin [Methanoregula sp.]
MGGILSIAITMMLAVLVLLLFHMPSFALLDSEVPAIFKITKIRHTNEKGILNYDSYMVVINSGGTGYENQNLYAKTYKNGIPLDCVISTMNGHDFISSQHFGVQNLAGFGAKGVTWYPNAMIWIDYTDKTFHPGDEVTLEVFDNTTNKIISRHMYTA